MKSFHNINKAHIERAKNFGGHDGTVTPEKLQEFIYDTRFCHYCKRAVARKKRTLDHVIPISRFGLHSMSNLVMACSDCNSSKSAMTGEEFFVIRERYKKANEALEKVKNTERKLSKILDVRNLLLKGMKNKK